MPRPKSEETLEMEEKSAKYDKAVAGLKRLQAWGLHNNSHTRRLAIDVLREIGEIE